MIEPMKCKDANGNEVEVSASDVEGWLNSGMSAEYSPLDYVEKRERILDECKFASQVETADGLALLIGFTVVKIVSPTPNLYLDAISLALRSTRNLPHPQPPILAEGASIN